MATTISPFFHQSHKPQSPLQITNIQRHVQLRPNLTMHFLTDLTFRRIAISQHKFRFNQIRVSFQLMAEQSKKNVAEPVNVDLPIKSKVSDELMDIKETEKSKTAIAPTPPEKPLPGDCCGNGCVPCVWDMYYEELEEYNRLCKEFSN